MLSPAFGHREEAIEKRFAKEEELRFKVNARAVRLFGTWAAEQLGMAHDDASIYAESLIDQTCEKSGFVDVVERVMRDFVEKDLSHTLENLHERLTTHREEAYQHMMKC